VFKDGILYCDRCGKPIRIVHSHIKVITDGKAHYCSTCHLLTTKPRDLIDRILRFFRKGSDP